MVDFSTIPGSYNVLCVCPCRNQYRVPFDLTEGELNKANGNTKKVKANGVVHGT